MNIEVSYSGSVSWSKEEIDANAGWLLEQGVELLTTEDYIKAAKYMTLDERCASDTLDTMSIDEAQVENV